MQNISKEDYLGVIYKYKDENGEIKPKHIAEMLQVSNAAVTDMLRKLSRDGHIIYKKFKSIHLTDSGENYARKIVRRHRIWEVFLNRIVGLPWEKVHDEANRLEHSASDELINRLEEMLEFPKYDPHGDPIPSKDGKIQKLRKHVQLADLKQGQGGTVIRVNDFDERFLSYISEIGVMPGEEIFVKQVYDFDKSMLVIIKKKEINISSTIAANIFVGAG